MSPRPLVSPDTLQREGAERSREWTPLCWALGGVLGSQGTSWGLGGGSVRGGFMGAKVLRAQRCSRGLNFSSLSDRPIWVSSC